MDLVCVCAVAGGLGGTPLPFPPTLPPAHCTRCLRGACAGVAVLMFVRGSGARFPAPREFSERSIVRAGPGREVTGCTIPGITSWLVSFLMFLALGCLSSESGTVREFRSVLLEGLAFCLEPTYAILIAGFAVIYSVPLVCPAGTRNGSASGRTVYVDRGAGRVACSAMIFIAAQSSVENALAVLAVSKAAFSFSRSRPIFFTIRVPASLEQASNSFSMSA